MNIRQVLVDRETIRLDFIDWVHTHFGEREEDNRPLIFNPDGNSSVGKLCRILYWRKDENAARGAALPSLRVEVEIVKAGRKTHYHVSDVVIWSIPWADLVGGKQAALKAAVDRYALEYQEPEEPEDQTVNLLPLPSKKNLKKATEPSPYRDARGIYHW